MKNGSIIFSLCLLLALATPALAEGDTQAAEAPDAERAGPGHLERLEDAPIVVPRAERDSATSASVIRGNHVSIQVNVDGLGQNILGDAANEPSMAIDPTNPSNIVIGWRQFDTIASNFRQAGYAYSHDGGLGWTYPGVLDPGQFRSDPVLGVDSEGVFFYYSLSTVTTAEMFISMDKGITWTLPIGAPGGDKTWMNVDITGGIGDGNIYAIWNSQFTCCAPGTDFTRSTDGGFTYLGPLVLPSKPKWGTVDVGPDGEVYVVGTRLSSGSFPQAHLIQKSSDAQDPGVTPTFEMTTGLELGGTTVTGQTPNPGGLMGQVWVATDHSAGSTRGNVYVLGSVNPPGTDPLDVHFIRSTDGGATWTAPVRVNDDDPGTDAYQWFATMSVAPNGRIDVVWNDTRDDPSGQNSEVYYAYSTDAGDSWSAGLPVTPSFNSLVGHPNQNKIGDYYHMISDVDGAGLAYSATFNNEQDVWFLRVGDCNDNGAHDAVDIAGGFSEDCDFNGVPDECQDVVICFGCDNDGVCEDSENCHTCTPDCFTGPEGCGNGTCELALGEDCLSCPEDCAGRQKGSPKNKFCCGDGVGVNPVDCGDTRCKSSGFACSDPAVDPTCCGDGVCQGTENGANCEVDCGATIPVCGDGFCDPGEDCISCSSDCEGKLKGKPSRQFCCGDGTAQAPEGDGSRCDGNY